MADRAPQAPPGGSPDRMRRLQLPPPDRLRRLPSWLLNHLTGPGNRLVVARLGRPGLRVDYALLSTLEEFGPLSQAELGRRLGTDPSDIVAVVNRLTDEGLAVRKPNEHDRRRNAITITPAGRRALAELERRVEDAQDELLEPLSAAQRDALVSLLQQLVDHHHHLREPGP